MERHGPVIDLVELELKASQAIDRIMASGVEIKGSITVLGVAIPVDLTIRVPVESRQEQRQG